ncbi:hypothetical protein GQ53DRAFT_745061 [Thozetella sp. PMI_491]|nr:hypothetical protein GQ53DRAFT_745061 [Thozetella sp. PMI_491]
MKLFTAVFFSLLPVAFAVESCHYYDSAKYGNVYGTCGNPQTCDDNEGYVVDNQCSGGDNNKCCIKRTCVAKTGWNGYCTTVAHCNAVGSMHISGKCPGGDNIQCCYD